MTLLGSLAGLPALALKPLKAAPLVELDHFWANPNPGGPGVLLAWETLNELDVVGFRIYRSLDPGEHGTLVIDNIPGCGGCPSGAEYTRVDATAQSGVAYYYWLNSIAPTGNEDWTRADPAPVIWPAPASVNLDHFYANQNPGGPGVQLDWQTLNESDTVGFQIYRSLEPNEHGELVIDNIEGCGGCPEGRRYFRVDESAQHGVAYYYWLNAIARNGNPDWHRANPVPVAWGTPWATSAAPTGTGTAATSTSVPATSTSAPATSTSAPTATTEPGQPTRTSVPATATVAPTNTRPPGSSPSPVASATTAAGATATRGATVAATNTASAPGNTAVVPPTNPPVATTRVPGVTPANTPISPQGSPGATNTRGAYPAPGTAGPGTVAPAATSATGVGPAPTLDSNGTVSAKTPDAVAQASGTPAAGRATATREVRATPTGGGAFGGLQSQGLALIGIAIVGLALLAGAAVRLLRTPPA